MALVAERRGKYVLDYRDPRGKRRWETFTTREAADEALVKRRKQIAEATYVAPEEERTFTRLCEDFTEATQFKVKRNTWRDYSTNMRLHLVPYFGKRKIRGITRKQIESFQSACIEKGVGVPTTGKCMRLLSGMLGYALKHEWVPSNRAKGIDAPLGDAVDKRDIMEEVILSPAEFHLVLKNTAEKWKLAIRMAGLTGLRMGELLGLPWKHVHLDTATVDVRQQYTANHIGSLKTKASRRTVPLPAPLVTALRKHKLESEWSKPDDLVFCNTVGKPQAADYLRDGWHAALDKSGLHRRKFHALRHSYASALIRCHGNLKQISILCGHSSITITLDTYGHLLPGETTEVVEKLTADMCETG